MFESTLLTALTEHTALTAYLSTYTDSEGIFERTARI